jgi:hypothetical protein
MSEAREGGLFPVAETDRSTGLLPSQMLQSRKMIQRSARPRFM